jgi:hypothetical protein
MIALAVDRIQLLMIRTAGVLLAAIVLGCSQGQPSPSTLDDAVRAAVADLDYVPAVQLFRGPCLDRTCVLVAKEDSPREIALIVLASEAPFTVQAMSTQSVGATPGTLGGMETDNVEYVYGRIDDPRITRLEFDTLGQPQSFAVRAPGYAVAYSGVNGPPQGWTFLDATGAIIDGSG